MLARTRPLASRRTVPHPLSPYLQIRWHVVHPAYSDLFHSHIPSYTPSPTSCTFLAKSLNQRLLCIYIAAATSPQTHEFLFVPKGPLYFFLPLGSRVRFMQVCCWCVEFFAFFLLFPFLSFFLRLFVFSLHFIQSFKSVFPL